MPRRSQSKGSIMSATPWPVAMPLGGLVARRPSEIREQAGVLILVMAETGTGKTTLLESLWDLLPLPNGTEPGAAGSEWVGRPEYTPVAVFDIDHKAHVLRDLPGLHVYATNTWAQVDEATKQIERGLVGTTPFIPFPTVVYDGTTALQIASQEHVGVASERNPQIRQTLFGQANTSMVGLVKRARVMADKGVNVIFNIWSAPIKNDATGITTVLPDLTDTMQRRFVGLLDFVVYLERQPGANPYPPVMYTGGFVGFGTKTAVAPDSPLRKMPQIIYNPSYQSIFDSFRGAPWPTAKHAPPSAGPQTPTPPAAPPAVPPTTPQNGAPMP